MRCFIAGSAVGILLAGTAAAQAAPTQTTTANTVSQSDNAAYAVLNGGGSGGGSGDVHESGHLYGTPSVGGSYAAFSNPCGLSSSVNGAGGPIGVGISIASEGTGCTNRAMTAMWGQIGASMTSPFLPVIEAQFCQDKRAALAFYEGFGRFCPGTDASIIPVVRSVPKDYVAQGIPGSTSKVTS